MCVCVLLPTRASDWSVIVNDHCMVDVVHVLRMHADISEVAAQVERPAPVLHSVGNYHQEDRGYAIRYYSLKYLTKRAHGQCTIPYAQRGGANIYFVMVTLILSPNRLDSICKT